MIALVPYRPSFDAMRISPVRSGDTRRRHRCCACVSAFLLLTTRLAAQSTTPPPMPDSVRDYISAAMTTFRTHSVHRADVDWQSLEDSVVARSGNAQTPAGTWRALTSALRGVDVHSFLMPPAAMMMSGVILTPQASRAALSHPLGHLVDGDIALVVVPPHSGANRPAYVDSLQSEIAALDNAGACGWVVDLRENTGGNMWPMLAGVGPLLGAEVVGSMTNRASGIAWHYRDGRSWSGTDTLPDKPEGWATVVTHTLSRPTAPLAVLIGRATESSGEMTLLAFLGRPNTRSFGDSTGGRNSVNSSIPLRDGAMMIVTSAYPLDRLGRRYPLSVAPDELVPSTKGASDDAPLRRAVDWLHQQLACTRRR
jgi:carboxyl-terminal processing protease